jgi:hypothetical protein
MCRRGGYIYIYIERERARERDSLIAAYSGTIVLDWTLRGLRVKLEKDVIRGNNTFK